MTSLMASLSFHGPVSSPVSLYPFPSSRQMSMSKAMPTCGLISCTRQLLPTCSQEMLSSWLSMCCLLSFARAAAHAAS